MITKATIKKNYLRDFLPVLPLLPPSAPCEAAFCPPRGAPLCFMFSFRRKSWYFCTRAFCFRCFIIWSAFFSSFLPLLSENGHRICRFREKGWYCRTVGIIEATSLSKSLVKSSPIFVEIVVIFLSVVDFVLLLPFLIASGTIRRRNPCALLRSDFFCFWIFGRDELLSLSVPKMTRLKCIIFCLNINIIGR